MRTLKFRVYNYTRNEMTYDIENIQFKADGSLEQINTAQDNILWPDKECEVMQFTGLTDKSGVEIYEGDIVRQDGFNEVVEWNGGGAWWALVNIPDIHSGNHLSALDFDECEVIGNTYQNSELLSSTETK